MAKRIKYPVGIQTFEKIRKDGYVYVDKTDLIYELDTTCQYNFQNFGNLLQNDSSEVQMAIPHLIKKMCLRCNRRTS